MLRRGRWLFFSGGAVALAGGAALANTRFRERALRQGEALALLRSTRPERDLPPLLARFIERAGVSGDRERRAPRVVRFEQAAEIRRGPGLPWQPLSATQFVAVQRSAFLWFATGKLGPFDVLGAVDCYDGRRGWLDARLLGLVPVAHASGHDTDRAELVRYLAELPWAPHALLLNPELRFEQTSDRAVKVSVEGAAEPAAVRLDFDEQGDVVGAYAADRPRVEPGRPTELLAWSGRFGDYLEVGGLRIPTRARVAWQLPEGEHEYFRGRITRYWVE